MRVERHQWGGVFVVGDRVIGPNPERLRLNVSGGLVHLVAALQPAGSLQDWYRAIDLVAHFPRVMVGVYGAFVPVIQPLFDIPNFFIHYCGATSIGKTITQELSASTWGLPTSEGGGLLQSWDSTKVFLERQAYVFHCLPIYLEDSQVADPRVVGQAIYLIANAIGRGRGSLDGVRQTAYGPRSASPAVKGPWLTSRRREEQRRAS